MQHCSKNQKNNTYFKEESKFLRFFLRFLWIDYRHNISPITQYLISTFFLIISKLIWCLKIKKWDVYTEFYFETIQTTCSRMTYTLDKDLARYVPALIYKGILNMEVLSDKLTFLFSISILPAIYSN